MQPSIFPDLSKDILASASLLESIANDHVLSDLNISTSALRIMDFIKSKIKARPSDICVELDMKHSNVSQRLSNLENRKLVKRRYVSAERDRRNTYFSLTEFGEKTFEEVIKRIHQMNSEIASHFHTTEMQELYDLITHFNHVIRTHKRSLEKK